MDDKVARQELVATLQHQLRMELWPVSSENNLIMILKQLQRLAVSPGYNSLQLKSSWPMLRVRNTVKKFDFLHPFSKATEKTEKIMFCFVSALY